MRHGRIVIGITGASGAAYAVRLIRLLAESDIEVHVAISTLGRRLLFDELDIRRGEADALVGADLAGQVIIHVHGRPLTAANVDLLRVSTRVTEGGTLTLTPDGGEPITLVAGPPR